MAEQDNNKFEHTPEDDSVDASANESESPSEATKSKDPTLDVLAAEYALYGPLYDGRHVHGDEPG